MRKIVIAVGLLVLVTTSTLQAQTREGFWIGFGFGGGSRGTDDGTDRDSGVVGYLKLGCTISERFLLGVESNAWLRDESGVTVTHTNHSAVAYFYPSATSGFFLKGGLWSSRLLVEVSGITTSETGGGAVLGLGFDARVGDNWSITPVLNFNYGAFDGGNSNIVELGVGVSWH